MDKLRRFVDYIFYNFPLNDETAALKAEVLSDLTEKYNDLLNEGVNPDEAYRRITANIGDVNVLLAMYKKGNSQIYPHPFRRFFARMADKSLFALVTVLLWIVFLKRTPVLAIGRAETIYGLVSLIISVAVEAFMLSTIGTTPGKWLFGIHITEGNGRKLEFRDALSRGAKRLIFAEGLYIPIISWITMYKSYKTCKRGIIMDYDDYTVYEIKKVPFALGFIGTAVQHAIAFVLGIVLSIVFMTVPNKGDITTEQFIENYNYLVDYTYTEDTTRKLDRMLRFDVKELNDRRYGTASVKFEREGEGTILDGLSVRVSAYAEGLIEYRHELLFMAMSMGEGGIKDRFDILFNKVYGMGLDEDVSFTYGNIKADYNIEMDNFRLNFGKNIYSKDRGFIRSVYDRNPDGSVNYDSYTTTYHGRGRHMFGKLDDNKGGTLIIEYRITKE